MIRKILTSAIIFGIAYVMTYNNLQYLTDWSTSELVGYNTWTIIVIVSAILLTYKFTIKKESGSK